MKKTIPQTMPSYTIYLFFMVGLLAACSFRVLILFSHFKEELFRPVWYFGTVGYILFFLYRYEISQKRKRAIEQFGLIGKLEHNTMLTEDERQVMVYLLTSLRKSRENLNYLFIFGLSCLAIFADIYLSF